MMLLNTVSFPFADEYYSLILFLVIITLALTIILKSTKIFITQLILLLAFFFISESSSFVVGFLFIAAQIVLSLSTLYKLKKAIDRNYMLVLEKTHQARPNITKGDNGSQRSFYR